MPVVNWSLLVRKLVAQAKKAQPSLAFATSKWAMLCFTGLCLCACMYVRLLCIRVLLRSCMYVYTYPSSMYFYDRFYTLIFLCIRARTELLSRAAVSLCSQSLASGISEPSFLFLTQRTTAARSAACHKRQPLRTDSLGTQCGGCAAGHLPLLLDQWEGRNR